MSKLHIEKGRTGKTYCGLSTESAFTDAWARDMSRESCERCVTLQGKETAAGAARAAAAEAGAKAMGAVVTDKCRKPCQECPFARATPAGAMGGSGPATYVGQAYGPFLLSCHMDKDYEKDRRSTSLLQCAGAAIFRANTERAKLMPAGLLQLPKDTALVFADPAELVAHHGKVSMTMAQRFLREHPPEELLERELKDAGAQQVQMGKKP